MKPILLALMLAFGLSVSAQSEKNLCEKARNLYNQASYADAIKVAGKALEKNPSNIDCRRTRIASALKWSPDADTYVLALTDLGYLVDHGDSSEETYRNVGDAEAGLARFLFQDRDYANSLKHYQVAREAFEKAKTVSAEPEKYGRILEDTDAYIRQVKSEAKF